jgi:putative Holliday junction resolvase
MNFGATHPPSLPSRGVLVGVDPGAKRIGLAVTDAAQTLAMPLETLPVRTPALTLTRLQQVARDYRAVGWVVGLPLRMSGEEGTQSAKARTFGDWLARETGLPVMFWDERLSSSTAETLLWAQGETPSKDTGRIDGLAAQVILQSYLQGRSA